MNVERVPPHVVATCATRFHNVQRDGKAFASLLLRAAGKGLTHQFYLSSETARPQFVTDIPHRFGSFP